MNPMHEIYSAERQEELNQKLQELREQGEFEIVPEAYGLLLLDLDDEEARITYETRRGMVGRLFGTTEKERWRSKSGIGWHVVVSVPMMDNASTVALQAILGSDWKREALNLKRIHNGVSPASVLFRPVSIKEVPF